ncbi:MAG: metal ABC transporter permease [Pseudomonadota bacterium]
MIWDFLIAPFAEFGFMRRALIGSLAICIGSVPVGVFLLLRRMSLTGDAMAHAILPGAAIGFLISGLSVMAMTIGGILAGLLVALLAGLVTRGTALKEDASLAAFYLISLAFGVSLIAMNGSTVDVFHVLFGSVLALNTAALVLLATISSMTLVALAIFYRPLALECVDPGFLRSVSGFSAYTHFAFLALVVLNLVAGFQALGTLMSVGIMIVPAAAARLWSTAITGMILTAVIFAFASCIAGLLLSFHVSVPTGPAIIISAGAIYVVSVVFGSEGGLISSRFLQPQQS